MTNKITKVWTREEINLSVYHKDDTKAERVTGEVNGHKVQVVHHEKSDHVTVRVDNSAAHLHKDGAGKYVSDKTK